MSLKFIITADTINADGKTFPFSPKIKLFFLKYKFQSLKIKYKANKIRNELTYKLRGIKKFNKRAINEITIDE